MKTIRSCDINRSFGSIDQIKVKPEGLSELLQLVSEGEINQNTAKTVLAQMLETGETARVIVEDHGLAQISDAHQISGLVSRVLDENPEQVAEYLGGKKGVSGWFFGQVMHLTKGKANPNIVKSELEKQLAALED